MNCCNANGECTQGNDCPARVAPVKTSYARPTESTAVDRAASGVVLPLVMVLICFLAAQVAVYFMVSA